MRPVVRHLLANLPEAGSAEVTETLAASAGARIERIVSMGQASPEGFWYDQAEAEWVMVLTGHAHLLIEGDPCERDMRAGDAIFLAAHCRHRVSWTDPTQPTVWLAVFMTPVAAR